MDLTGTLREPAHTGANRCWPCTVVNVAIVAVLGVLAAALSPIVGVGLVVGGVAAIALRGYVVPYTPTFAPRLVAAIPGAERVFPDHETDRAAGGLGDPDADGDVLLAALIEAGVLEGDADLALAPAFATDWEAAMATLAEEPTAALADAVDDTAPGDTRTRTYEDRGKSWVILTDDADSVASETWLSRPVAIADVAAVRSLTDHGLDARTAADAAAPLRLFLDECPDCGGDIAETTVDGCCGGYGPGGPTHALACTDCGERLSILD